MTPPKAVGSAAPATPVLPGQPDPEASPPNAQGPDKYVQGKPTAPGAGGPLGHPLFGKIDLKKVDQEKAKTFAAQGDKFYEKQDFKNAQAAYEKAFQADPNHAPVTLRLAEVCYENGDPLTAYDYLSLYLENRPEDVSKRGTRIQLGQLILSELEKKAKTLQPQELKQAQVAAASLIATSRMDQAIVLASTSGEQLESLKKLGEDLRALHSEPVEKKMKVLREMMANLHEMSLMTQLPISNPKLAAMVYQEIPKLITESYGVLADFAKADPDENISRYAPLFESSRLLAQGKLQEALPFLEAVRGNGFKQYGGGDEAKGRDRFLKEMGEVRSLAENMKKLGLEAQALFRENRDGEANIKVQQNNEIADKIQNYFDSLPEGLLEAHRILSLDGNNHMRRANLAILALLRGEIQKARAALVEEYTGTWAVAWRSVGYGVKALVGSDSSKFDDINAETAKRLDLVDAVEGKIHRGEASSVKEALAQIQANGSDELKASAKELADQGSPLLAGLIQYAGEAEPNAAMERALLDGTKPLRVFHLQDEALSSMYAIILLCSRDAENRKIAETELEEDRLPAYVKEQTEEPSPPGVFRVKTESISGTLNASGD
ncbi:MAG: tetratricopeptide repeat protein [bacterium]